MGYYMTPQRPRQKDTPRKTEIVPVRTSRELVKLGQVSLPTAIAAAGRKASRRFIQFFIAEIENDHTRQAYGRAVWQFFDWCDRHQLDLDRIEPVHVAAYIKFTQTKGRLDPRTGQPKPLSKPAIKQHLAAIRRLFDYLIVGQVLEFNPAAPVRGPKLKVRKGKTPIVSAEEAGRLLNSIDTSSVVGLRDRALIGTMLFTFIRVSEALALTVGDYHHQGRDGLIRVTQKGGVEDIKPVHHQLEQYLDAYIEAAGIAGDHKAPLFPSARGKTRTLTDRVLHRRNALDMIKRRVRAAGLPDRLRNHSFRGAGITLYLQAGGTLERAQRMAGHADPRTTKLYDHTEDPITRAEVERIQLSPRKTVAGL